MRQSQVKLRPATKSGGWAGKQKTTRKQGVFNALFSPVSSTLYAGQRLATIANAISLSSGADTTRADVRGLLGETGFKPGFAGELDTILPDGGRTDVYNDQTHHFVTYFSAGLNGFSSAALIHKYLVENNEPDRRLADAGFDLGVAIRGKPELLRTVRADFLKKICDDRPR